MSTTILTFFAIFMQPEVLFRGEFNPILSVGTQVAMSREILWIVIT